MPLIRPVPRLGSGLRRATLTVSAVSVFTAVVLFATAAPASAHADLASSTPAAGSVLGVEPAQVTLTFSEEVDLRLSIVKVVGPDGRRLDTGPAAAGPAGASSLTANLAPDTAHGSFTIVWQVVAADDGHASSGDFTFAVGAPSEPAHVAAFGHDALTSGLSDAAQWAGFFGLAMVGGVTTLRTRRDDGLGGPGGEPGPDPDAAPGRPSVAALIRQDAGLAASAARPTAAWFVGQEPAVSAPLDPLASQAIQPDADTAAAEQVASSVPDTPPRIPTWPITAGWSILVAATIVQILAYAPASQGLSPTHLLDRSLLAATLATRDGHALMARMALLAFAALVGEAVLRRGRSPLMPVAFTVAVAATWGATGHAATGTAAPIAMTSLTVHVAAMALWVGGLAALVLLPFTGAGAAMASTAARFSRLALAAVGALAATGVYQAWREAGSLNSLTHSAFGRVLLMKVLLLLVVLGVASRSRARATHWREGDEAALHKTVLVELIGAAVLLVLAVLLSGNAPPRS